MANENSNLSVAVKTLPDKPIILNPNPPINPKIKPVIIPVTIEDLTKQPKLRPNELNRSPLKPICQIIGIEKVNKKEPYIPLRRKRLNK